MKMALQIKSSAATSLLLRQRRYIFMQVAVAVAPLRFEVALPITDR